MQIGSSKILTVQSRISSSPFICVIYRVPAGAGEEWEYKICESVFCDPCHVDLLPRFSDPGREYYSMYIKTTFRLRKKLAIWSNWIKMNTRIVVFIVKKKIIDDRSFQKNSHRRPGLIYQLSNCSSKLTIKSSTNRIFCHDTNKVVSPSNSSIF